MSKLSRLYDRNDVDKWAHPEVRDFFKTVQDMFRDHSLFLDEIYNFDLPYEQRRDRARAENQVSFLQPYEGDNMREFSVSGCPEEPEAPEVNVKVFFPTTKRKKGLKVIFYVMGGGMYGLFTDYTKFNKLCQDLGAVVVTPAYRIGIEEPYPAALNDLHAAYQWMIESADDLGIDPDKVVISGASTGSHLSLSLAHRLKRYGYAPRGCVVECAFVDNMPVYPTSPIKSATWDSRAVWACIMQYLGLAHFPQQQTAEMMPNSCEAEDCVGLCPTFIHCDVEEGDAAGCADYCNKLTVAGVYNELHSWGGACHGAMANAYNFNPEADLTRRYMEVFYGNIRDCWKYDLRRSWIKDVMAED